MINHSNELIVLFDEQGTPTFKSGRESEYFIGVAVSYLKSDESQIFFDCDKDCGLSKIKVLKNSLIGNTRANDIALKISSLPIQVTVAFFKLGDIDLQRVVNLYEDYGNVMRTLYRQVRNRPIAQILRTQILNHVLFSAISNYLYQFPNTARASIFSDNWSFPKADELIALDYSKESMEYKINEIFKTREIKTELKINDYNLLKGDSQRKRFIDAVASIASRSYLNKSDPKYSSEILQILTSNKTMNHEIENITQTTIGFLTKLMDSTARGI